MQAYVTLTRRELGSFLFFLDWLCGHRRVDVPHGLELCRLAGQIENGGDADAVDGNLHGWLFLVHRPFFRAGHHHAALLPGKYSGTFETLMTTPVSDWQVVLAKFTAAIIFTC